MRTGRAVHVVVPEGIADPQRPSGGNTYDRRLCRALSERGWAVCLREVAGDWPRPRESGWRALEAAVGATPDGGLVLVDGLVASAAPEALVPASRRVRLVVLMHMPLGVGAGSDDPRCAEQAVLAAAAGVVTTSDWTRRWLLATYGLDADRVQVARPGVDPAPAAPVRPEGRRLLCVGAVVPAKGHDRLVAALAELRGHAWRCVCVGPLTRDPGFVARLRDRIDEAGLRGRVVLAGPATGAGLEASYAAADLLVHPSRAETYGMVVTEALARGLPVVATDAGGLGEALGTTGDGRRPGTLVPAGDVSALASALRRWWADAEVRGSLRSAARRRRCELTGWDETAGRVARALEEAVA